MTAPAPRPGLDAIWDRLVGPGANAAEQAAVVAAASVGAIAGGLLPRTRTERLLGVAIGADAAGGLVANETTPVKRWYHREGQPAWEPAAFAAFHVYPFLVEAASGRRAWGRAALAWALPVLASGVVAAAHETARPTAAVLATGVAVTGARLAPPGWRWLPPLLAYKLVFGHATTDGGSLARLLRPEPSDTAR
ncbi:MAG TPA: hypothetical protein VFY23_13785 [Candidatus Limnocylindrales bacterium]|nr:hypothetical protein [Candidatus Limnocylindrales bacterium]